MRILFLTILIGCSKPDLPVRICEKMPSIWCAEKCLLAHEKSTDEPILLEGLVTHCRDMSKEHCYKISTGDFSYWDHNFECKQRGKE